MTQTFGQTADYIGRRFDLLALRGARPVGDALLSQTLFGPDAGGEVCTGVQQLAQRWVLHFLTVRGSMPFWPERGTEFLTEARQGLFRTELDVVQSFGIAEAEVRRAMGNEETPTDNPEERLAGAELLEIQLQYDRLALTIEVRSQAGDARRVVLPIPYLPIRTDV